MRPNPLIPTFTLAMSLLLAISKESNGDAPAKPCTKRAGRQGAACGADHERPGGFAGGPVAPSGPPPVLAGPRGSSGCALPPRKWPAPAPGDGPGPDLSPAERGPAPSEESR